MSTDDVAIKVEKLSKCYQIYAAPRDRLKQFVLPRLQRLARQSPKQYFREFWALKDVSFEIKKGETVGIIGRNGSGKSTLLQMICGTLYPTIGTVKTYGRIAALLELGSGFNPEFTGRENVYMNALVLGLSQEEVDQRFEDIAAFADIGDFIEQPVKTYSSGMAARLAFAVSIYVAPEILIIDEALSVGDVGFQFKCMERLNLLIGSETTLFFVSHDMGMVKALCQRAIYLKKGQLFEFGATEAVVESYLMDMRDAQSRSASANLSVTPKATSAGANRAFGTDQGAILDASFVDTGLGVYVPGDRARIRVTFEYDSTVRRPTLVVGIMDRRYLLISGSYCTQISKTENTMRLIVESSFDVKLTAGRYFITLAIEDRLTHSITKTVDKQVGILSFEVVPHETSPLLGMVDLGIKFDNMQAIS